MADIRAGESGEGGTVDRRRKASSWRWTAKMETTDPPRIPWVLPTYVTSFPDLRPRKSLIFEQGSVFHPMSLRLTRCLLTWNSFGPR